MYIASTFISILSGIFPCVSNSAYFYSLRMFVMELPFVASIILSYKTGPLKVVK